LALLELVRPRYVGAVAVLGDDGHVHVCFVTSHDPARAGELLLHPDNFNGDWDEWFVYKTMEAAVAAVEGWKANLLGVGWREYRDPADATASRGV
jgi:hypothetical protein